MKAFHSGDYDECIEKAIAAATNSSKKSVKYAQRKYAILHALEIKSEHLVEDHCSSARESLTVSYSGKENEDLTDEIVNPRMTQIQLWNYQTLSYALKSQIRLTVLRCTLCW